MSSRKNKKGKIGSYDIGYGKTPPYTRYPKGKSGNLGGRPTKTRKLEETDMDISQSELDELLRAELDRVVTINEGGKPKKMKARELVPRSQINSAIKGNAISQQHVMRAIRELELRDAERAKALVEQREAKRQQDIATYKYMVSQKQERQNIWTEATANGTEPDQPWPHPDDILLFPKHQCWLPRGPFDEAGAPYYKYLQAERDYLFVNAVLERRANRKRRQTMADINILLWVSYDVMLPLRWQVAHDCGDVLWLFHVMPLRDLRAILRNREQRRDELKLLAGILPPDKEVYREVNAIMKPLLKRKGYRSLAEFEHAYEAHGENMPWPKGPSQVTAE